MWTKNKRNQVTESHCFIRHPAISSKQPFVHFQKFFAWLKSVSFGEGYYCLVKKEWDSSSANGILLSFMLLSATWHATYRCAVLQQQALAILLISLCLCIILFKWVRQCINLFWVQKYQPFASDSMTPVFCPEVHFCKCTNFCLLLFMFAWYLTKIRIRKIEILALFVCLHFANNRWR